MCVLHKWRCGPGAQDPRSSPVSPRSKELRQRNPTLQQRRQVSGILAAQENSQKNSDVLFRVWLYGVQYKTQSSWIFTNSPWKLLSHLVNFKQDHQSRSFEENESELEPEFSCYQLANCIYVSVDDAVVVLVTSGPRLFIKCRAKSWRLFSAAAWFGTHSVH